MTYALGLLPPDPKKSSHRLHASWHPALRAAPSPKGSASLQAAPCMDQGNTGTCHAHATAGAVWCALNAAGKESFVPSPRDIASCTYADVRAAANPGALPLLLDVGADLSDDMKAIATWGIAPIAAPTSDGRFSDIENDPDPPAPPVFPEPVPARLVVAGNDLIQGEYAIPVDENAATLCAQALDAGIPIVVGFYCDPFFQSLGPNDVALAPVSSLPGGGHAVYIVAYRTAANGTFKFKIQNSWGTLWADQGQGWVSQAWLEAAWLLWPMAISPNLAGVA